MRIWTVTLLAVPLLGGCVVYEDRYHTPGVTPVQKADVLAMRASGHSDDQILATIHANGVARHPSADEVIDLKAAGVPDTLVNAMIEAPVTAYRPASEYRRRYFDPEPVLNLGAAALTGYLIGRHFRH